MDPSFPDRVSGDVECSSLGCTIVGDGAAACWERRVWWELVNGNYIDRLVCGDDGDTGGFSNCDWTGEGIVDAGEGKDNDVGKPWLESRHPD